MDAILKREETWVIVNIMVSKGINITILKIIHSIKIVHHQIMVKHFIKIYKKCQIDFAQKTVIFNP